MATNLQQTYLPNLQEGDVVDLGAAGKYIKNPDGTYQIAPTTTATDQPPITPTGTSTGSAVLSSSGARDAVVKATDYIAQNTPPPPEITKPPIRSEFTNDATYQAALTKFNTTGNWATPAPTSTLTSSTSLQPGQYGFVKEANGTYTYYDANGNVLPTNPIGGDNQKNNPQPTANLIQLSAAPKPPSTQSSNSAFDDYTRSLQSRITQADKDAADLKAKSQEIMKRLDTANAALINSITANYAAAIEKQKNVNNAYLAGVTQSGIRGGQQRYAPEDYAAQIAQEANNGIDRVVKLEGERDKLIAEAQTAAATKNWDVYYDTYKALQDNRTNQTKNLQDLYEQSQKLKEQAQKQAAQEIENLTKIQTFNKNKIASLANLADTALAEYEKNNDEEGGAKFIKDLAEQYGLDPNLILSSVQELRAKNKGWSDPYDIPGIGKVQRNVQTGEIRTLKAGSSDGSGTDIAETELDPTSQSILAQTGLSFAAFMALTGQMSQLSRDKTTRAQALKEAQAWANKQGIDISTMGSQYKSYNEVLSANIKRMNNTKIMESELDGTIANLQGVVNDADLSRLNVANVIRIWAGQEVNDSLAQQYAVHLYQLKNELAAYGAATQGRSGGDITIQDQHEAEQVIKNGIASGSLSGLQTAIKNSTGKMGIVMQNSVDAARKAVWDLFGVASNYKGTSSTPTDRVSVIGPDGKVGTIPRSQLQDAIKQGYRQQ